MVFVQTFRLDYAAKIDIPLSGKFALVFAGG